jgi:hypothetical protein
MCNADLVESLDAGATPAARREPPPDSRPAPEPTSAYCGFLSLEEAREAKRRMREAGFHAEVLIRDGQDERGRESEEYWLLLPARAFKAAQEIVGFDHAEVREDEDVLCSVCDRPVREDASECPHCGARFEEA